MKRYIGIPEKISYENVEENYHKLSSNAYKRLLMKNTNYKTLGELLELYQSGKEVGSLAYTENSLFKFIRTKAIDTNLFCLDFSKQGAFEFIKPDFYKTYFREFMDLKMGDILFVTGGNVGEVAFIEKDYSNIIFSSHIIKLKTLENPYYLFTMLKHDVCKEQVNLSPIGAIKGLDTFKVDYLLNCKIPFPNHNAEQSIKFIEILTKSIIKKEALIKTKHEAILRLIENELLTHQLPYSFSYSYPTLEELKISGRLDTGIYSEEFKSIEFLIKNYKNGVFYLDKDNIRVGTTPTMRVFGDTLKYTWIAPKHCNEFGTIENEERINFLGNPNLTQDCILLVCRGDKNKLASGIFYSIEQEGLGQYNQDFYKISNYPKSKLLFMLCFLNTKFMRKYCNFLSTGMTIKAFTISNFLQIPFPNFPQNIQEKIAMLYHNPHLNLDYKGFNLENFTELDNEFCNKAGIYDLDKSIKHLKEILNSSIDKIIDDEKVHIAF